jgi:hypothetical protein
MDAAEEEAEKKRMSNMRRSVKDQHLRKADIRGQL